MKLIIDNTQRHQRREKYNLEIAILFSRYPLWEKTEIITTYYDKLDREEQARRLLKQRQQTPAANDGILLR